MMNLLKKYCCIKENILTNNKFITGESIIYIVNIKRNGGKQLGLYMSKEEWKNLESKYKK